MTQAKWIYTPAPYVPQADQLNVKQTLDLESDKAIADFLARGGVIEKLKTYSIPR